MGGSVKGGEGEGGGGGGGGGGARRRGGHKRIEGGEGGGREENKNYMATWHEFRGGTMQASHTQDILHLKAS